MILHLECLKYCSCLKGGISGAATATLLENNYTRYLLCSIERAPGMNFHSRSAYSVMVCIYALGSPYAGIQPKAAGRVSAQAAAIPGKMKCGGSYS